MYQKAIVTFLDILGFGDFVKNHDAKEIWGILNEVERITSPNLEIELVSGFQPEVISFSDSIVRVRKVETEENLAYQIGLLFHELLDLVHVQSELIGANLLIRGGISFGEIYISDGQVFGPGLIAAYELESKFAKYPRIIVDPQLIQEYKSNKLLKARHHTLEQDLEYVGDLVKQGDDGMWFVDYAKAVERELDAPEMYPTFLQQHRNVILSGSEKHKILNSELSKYLWMASYHNQVVSGVSDAWYEQYNLKKSDLIITSDEMTALQYVH